nr:hypothetical protein CFP56_69503 [Quercus suber]
MKQKKEVMLATPTIATEDHANDPGRPPPISGRHCCRPRIATPQHPRGCRSGRAGPPAGRWHGQRPWLPLLKWTRSSRPPSTCGPREWHTALSAASKFCDLLLMCLWLTDGRVELTSNWTCAYGMRMSTPKPSLVLGRAARTISWPRLTAAQHGPYRENIWRSASERAASSCA